MRRFLLLSLISMNSLVASRITLTNDSAFPLRADIYTAQGDKVMSVPLSAGQTYIWSYDQGPFVKQYDKPYVPFTIRWICPNVRPYDYNTPPKNSNKDDQQKKPAYQSEYGVWFNISTGALVNAQGSSGTNTCVVKKGYKPVDKPSKRGFHPGGDNNWSNDGGQTWTNDGGPGWDGSED